MNAGIPHYIAASLLVQDTPRLGRALAAERDWSASAHQPANRKTTPVRESWHPALFDYFLFCVLIAAFAWAWFTPGGQVLLDVLRSQP